MTTLVAGLGSVNGDDRAGWLVADRLRRALAGGAADGQAVSVRRAASPLDVLDWLDGVCRLVICDAANPAGQPGRCRRWIWPTAELGALTCIGSHDFGLPAALELAGGLGILPPRVVVFGVEAGDCRVPGRMTPAVDEALGNVVAAVLAECRCG